MIKKRHDRRAQVWVETAIYTLIGLTIIGVILAGVKPQIDKMKDKIVIEQSMQALEEINQKITESKVANGNRRIVEVKIGKGELLIDASRNTITWTILSKKEYSELNKEIGLGSLNITTKTPGPYTVELKLSPLADIEIETGNSGSKIYSESPTPYKISLENKGMSGGLTKILIREV